MLPTRPRGETDMHIITDPPKIATAFACAVTVLAKPEFLVARNGDLSIFSAYRQIFPQARITVYLFSDEFSFPRIEFLIEFG